MADSVFGVGVAIFLTVAFRLLEKEDFESHRVFPTLDDDTY